jgi:hypothetical protein
MDEIKDVTQTTLLGCLNKAKHMAYEGNEKGKRVSKYEGKMLRGRTKLRWETDIKNELKERVLERMVWIEFS